jgi:hypothetical protein
VGGSFEVIGKITGTFLQATKTLQGEKYNQLSIREPENIIDGVYTGMKEAIKDFASGVTGIVTNPFKGAKKGGIKGFFKGLGTGVVGLALSPFAIVLRLGNNVFIGMKNNLNFNANLKTMRFRYPRVIEKNVALKSYNEDLAIVKAILLKLKDKEHDFKDDDIIYFKQFNYFEFGLNNNDFRSSLILTNKHVLVVYEAKKLEKEILLNNIKNVEVHKENENNDENFLIVFGLKKGKKQFIKTDDLKLCTEFYSLLSKNLVDVDAVDKKNKNNKNLIKDGMSEKI